MMSQISIRSSTSLEQTDYRNLTLKERIEIFDRLYGQHKAKEDQSQNKVKIDKKKFSLNDSRFEPAKQNMSELSRRRHKSFSAKLYRNLNLDYDRVLEDYRNEIEQKEASIADGIKRAVKCLNEFSFYFYSKTCSGTSKNVAFSSMPLFYLLNLFRACSDHKLKESISKILYYADSNANDGESFENDLKHLEHLLQENNGILLNFEAYSRENYLSESHKKLLSNLRESDRDLNEAHGMVLNEVSQQTLDQNMENLFMLFSRGIDLNLEWKRHFRDLNEKGTFVKANSEIVTINLMNIPKHRFLYCRNPENLPVKLCEFPFRNDELVFTVLLPEKNALERIEKELNPDLFNRLVDKMKFVQVNSVLPKFSINDRLSLGRLLSEIDAITDFDQKGFGLCVDQALYTSSISVNYASINAKSSTHVILARDRISNTVKREIEHPSEEFTCDNPFLFFIRNKYSRLILFMGKLMVPDRSD